MKRLLAILAVLALAGPAYAADIAVKAPAIAAFPFGSQGWYVGIGTLAATTNAELTMPSVGTTGTITTAGAGVGPVFGYHKGTAESFWEVEGSIYWQNLGGTQAVSTATVNDRFSGGGRVKLGGTSIFATLGNLLPNLGLTGVFPPAPVSGQGNMPYFSVGFDVNQVQASVIGVETKGTQITPTFGTGFMSIIMDPVTGKPSGYVTDTSIEYTPAGKGVTLGGDGTANLGRKVMAKFAILR